MRDLSQLSEDVRTEMLGGDGGAFTVLSPTDYKFTLRVIASFGGSWDHVSVSRADRIPTWQEMNLVARLFFLESETAVQFHVPASKHVNIHPNCLHLWRHQRVKYQLPPLDFV